MSFSKFSIIISWCLGRSLLWTQLQNSKSCNNGLPKASWHLHMLWKRFHNVNKFEHIHYATCIDVSVWLPWSETFLPFQGSLGYEKVANLENDIASANAIALSIQMLYPKCNGHGVMFVGKLIFQTQSKNVPSYQKTQFCDLSDEHSLKVNDQSRMSILSREHTLFIRGKEVLTYVDLDCLDLHIWGTVSHYWSIS